MQPVTAFTAYRNLSQPALIHHNFSRPISACLDLSQLIITYHNPQRFIAVRVIVYPLLILTYKFTKIKGFSKNFFKTGKDICRRKNIIITIPRYTALQSHIPHSNPLIRRVSACVLIRFCICTITLTPHYPSKIAITFLAYERSVGFASVQSLWAFNFGHPCPSLAKGELLLLSKAQPTIEESSHQHRLKHFSYRQEINIFVSISVQLH